MHSKIGKILLFIYITILIFGLLLGGWGGLAVVVYLSYPWFELFDIFQNFVLVIIAYILNGIIIYFLGALIEKYNTPGSFKFRIK